MPIRDVILDFLFPKTEYVLSLEELSPEELLRELPEAENGEVIALFDYGDVQVKKIIWEIKYSGNEKLASTLGILLHDVIIQELEERNLLFSKQKIILMPMPISDRRRNERGWNQAELIAKAISSADSVNLFDYRPRVLVKERHTESQTLTHSKSERMNNLNDSMKVVSPASIGTVVLIDDVSTTGSTFTEARRALRAAGFKKILCFSIAH